MRLGYEWAEEARCRKWFWRRSAGRCTGSARRTSSQARHHVDVEGRRGGLDGASRDREAAV